MISLWSIFSLMHLVGLALGVGAATVKLTLLLKCNADHALVPAYVKVARPITRTIISGLVILTLSGIGWMFLGFSFSAMLILKIALVAAIWVIGPFIDNVVEPRFEKLAPMPGEQAAPAFIRVQRLHLALEAIATALFYAVAIMGVLLI